MKKLGILLLGAAFVSFAFTGCEQLLADYAKKADYATKADVTAVTGQNSTCMGCHNTTTVSTAGVQSLNAIGATILAAQGEYEESGHFNGYRELVVNTTTNSFEFEAPSSNAMYANSSGCAKCHTAQGFIQFALGQTITDQPWSSQTGCQTCHQPHKTGDMTTLRTTATGATGPAAVTLVDTTTIFDKGDGNLCANCHQARGVTSKSSNFTATATSNVTLGTVTGSTTATTPFAVSTTKPTVKDAATTGLSLMMMSRAAAHHGPNADMLMGVGGVIDSSVNASTTTNPSPHYSSATDSCVTCHMYKAPAGSSTSGTLAVGGHGKYLTEIVHGTQTDMTASCKQCHLTTGATNTVNNAKAWPTATWANPSLGVKFSQSNHTAGADYDGNLTTSDIMVEIQGLITTLVNYFGNGANFTTVSFSVDSAGKYTQYVLAPGAAGEGAAIALATKPGAATTAYSATTSGNRWLTDWQYQSYTDPLLALNTTTGIPTTGYTGKAFPYMTAPQAKAFANLQFVMEDKSLGVHNPTYVAKMLYSSIKLINGNLPTGGVPLTIGTTAP